MLINRTTNELYVGSTYSLGERLRHYFKNSSSLKLRPILQEIKNLGISSFNVRIYLLPTEYQEVRLLIALEQYFILSMNPKYNTLMVANGSPGGMRVAKISSLALSIPIYVYVNKILVYIFDSMAGMTNNAITGLNVSTKSIYTALNTGRPYLNVFILTRKPLEPIDTKTLIPLEGFKK